MTADMGAAWGAAGLQPSPAGYYGYDTSLGGYRYEKNFNH